MSIRDFDPLLKRIDRRTGKRGSVPKGKQRRQGLSSAVPPEVQPTGSAGITPIKISVGRSNIVVDGSSESSLYEGLKDAFGVLAKDLQWYTEQLEGFLPNDLTEALKPTLELSAYYCPKDTLALVNSRYVATEQYRGGARCEIGYARGGEPHYAIYVHEIPATHDPPTTDKFLQRAIDEDYHNIVQRVTDNLRVRMGLS